MKLFGNIFSGLSGYKSILECLKKNISPVSVTGLSPCFRNGRKQGNACCLGYRGRSKKIMR